MLDFVKKEEPIRLAIFAVFSKAMQPASSRLFLRESSLFLLNARSLSFRHTRTSLPSKFGKEEAFSLVDISLIH